MVDSIKGKVSPTSLAASSAESTLRKSFRSLTSASVTEVASRVTQSNPSLNTSPNKVAKVLNSLSDAVSFSTLALKSLENLKGELADSGSDDLAMQGLASGITNLEENVNNVLDSLRRKLDAAEVVSENISSADSKIEDIGAAKKQAADTSSQVRGFDEKEVLSAHSGISAARVLDLLSD